MPIYRFYCPTCKKPIEIKESMHSIDKIIPFCSKCDTELERRFTAPGIKYVGDGWTKKAEK